MIEGLKITDAILRDRGKRWGRARNLGDRVLERPELLAIRSTDYGHHQALYKTVDNPRRDRVRGFIMDDRDGFCGEQTLAAIMKHSGGWPWQPVAGGAPSTQSASGAPSSADLHSRAHN